MTNPIKQAWNYIINGLYFRLVQARRDNRELRERLRSNEIVIDAGSFELTKPTQADKPSPSSTLTKSEAATLADLIVKQMKRRGKESIHHTVEDTNSMEPIVDDNCFVILEIIKDGFKIREGMIVIYARPNPQDFHKIQLVIHRIWKISTSNKSFYIKGDNNYFADGWVSKSKIRSNLYGIIYFEQDEEGD